MINRNYYIKAYQFNDFQESIDGVTEYHFTDKNKIDLNPGGYFELIFQSGNFYQSSCSNQAWNKRPSIFIGGLHKQSFSIRPEEESATLISIRFKPAFAKNFIPDRLNLYKNKVVALEDVFKLSDLESAHSILSANNTQDKLTGIHSLLKQLYRPKTKSPIDTAVTLIERSTGCLPISDIGHQVNLGTSQFRKRFTEEIGMSPKEFSRIIRIDAIQKQLNNGAEIKLTELAYHFNYFDQSHFIKDFQAVVGLSPKKYLRNLGRI